MRSMEEHVVETGMEEREELRRGERARVCLRNLERVRREKERVRRRRRRSDRNIGWMIG